MLSQHKDRLQHKLILVIIATSLLISCKPPVFDNPNDPFSSSWQWEYASAPTFSSVQLISSTPLSISIHTTEKGEDVHIHYTIDGSSPDESSNLYTSPILITETTILSARTLVPGKLASAITKHTYEIR